MKRNNRIAKLIEQKFGLAPEPTKALLHKLGITINRFNQIVNNAGSKEMNAVEIYHFSNWLNVSEGELFEDEAQPVRIGQ